MLPDMVSRTPLHNIQPPTFSGRHLQATGRSVHEVRTWVAAYSALAALGPYEMTYRYYRPIRDFIAGFAVTTALPTR